jgi:hypothetical protein
MGMVFIICFIAAWGPIGKIIPLRLSSSFSMQKPANAIRVMDWNVSQFEILQFRTNPELKFQMMQLINQYQPDIACFQEMVCNDTAISPGLLSHLPYFWIVDFPII